VHLVAFTPKPLLIELEIQQVGENKMLVGDLAKTPPTMCSSPTRGPGSSSLPSCSAACRPTTTSGSFQKGPHRSRDSRTAQPDGGGMADRAGEPPMAGIVR